MAKTVKFIKIQTKPQINSHYGIIDIEEYKFPSK